MARFIDPFYSNTFLDANIFNELAGEHSEGVKEILRVYDEERITLLLPYSVQAELEEPETPKGVRDVARTFIYSIEVQLTEGERATYRRLLQEVSGNAEAKNIDRDLFHVFEAHKNGGGHFVTYDKRLLKRGSLIADLLHIEVVTPDDFVEKVREAKARQAEFERQKQRS